MKLKRKAESIRETGKRKVNPTIVVVCEGKETEIDYFLGFNAKYRRVDVRVADKKAKGKNRAKATDPENLVNRAVDIKNNDFDIKENDGDRVWCIFDVDINYNNNNAIQSKIEEIDKAKRLADKKHIKLGISNPCFELWYLLHFEYTTANLKDYNAVKRKLVKYIIDYDKNKSIYNKLKEYVHSAIMRGRKLKNHHEGLGKIIPNIELNNDKLDIKTLVESNPYTTVVDLIEYMEQIENDK